MLGKKITNTTFCKMEHVDILLQASIDMLSSEELLVREYILEMDELDKIALRIAMEHLGTSFDIIKSNGYIEWLKKRSG